MPRRIILADDGLFEREVGEMRESVEQSFGRMKTMGLFEYEHKPTDSSSASAKAFHDAKKKIRAEKQDTTAMSRLGLFGIICFSLFGLGCIVIAVGAIWTYHRRLQQKESKNEQNAGESPYQTNIDTADE